MASRNISDLHPLMIPKYNDFMARCKTSGIDCFVTCTHRSNKEQAELYAQGRTKPGNKVTKAKPGQSAHNNEDKGKPAALAFDIAIMINGKLNWDAENPTWQLAIQHGKDAGLKNLFPYESAHFEHPDWKQLKSN